MPALSYRLLEMITRRAEHAGSWYEAKGHVLDKQLQKWLNEVDTNDVPSQSTSVIEVGLPGYTPSQSSDTLALPVAGCKAIIAPHAGYSYSGAAAAYAYKCIDPTKYKRVFILGPSHKAYYDGCCLSSCHEYDTPLGELPLDRATIKELSDTKMFLKDVKKDLEESEHSIELHLPYIRKVFADQDISIVPIIVGSLSTAKEMKMGQLLAPYLKDESTLFVISSDFCHWGQRFSYTTYQPDPETRISSLTSKTASDLEIPIHASIRALDGAAISHLTFPHSLPTPNASKLITDPSTYNTTPTKTAKEAVKGFKEYLDQTHNTICGRHPIGVLIATLAALEAEGTKSELRFTRYEQSSQCEDYYDSSVSYASAFVRLSE